MIKKHKNKQKTSALDKTWLTEQLKDLFLLAEDLYFEFKRDLSPHTHAFYTKNYQQNLENMSFSFYEQLKMILDKRE